MAIGRPLITDALKERWTNENRKFTKFGISLASMTRALSRLVAILIDLERSDLRVERGGRNAKFSGCARGPRHASSGFGQCRLDRPLLLRRRHSEERCVGLFCRGRSAREPALIDRKVLRFTDNDG